MENVHALQDSEAMALKIVKVKTFLRNILMEIWWPLNIIEIFGDAEIMF